MREKLDKYSTFRQTSMLHKDFNFNEISKEQELSIHVNLNKPLSETAINSMITD